jgi:flagellar hook-associated protein 3 FlgL
MSLRLSGTSSYILFQRNLGLRNAELFKSSEQLSSQKRINRPSDDPEGAKAVLNFRTALDRIDQYKSNILAARRSLVQTENAVSGTKTELDRIKEIALQANNSFMSTEARLALAEEVRQITQTVLGLANTEVNGEYIFSGFKTDTLPFTLDANFPTPPTATYNGDTNLKSVKIGEGETIESQIRGDLLFLGDGGPRSVDIFQVLGTLENTLRTEVNPAANPGDPDHFDTISAALGESIEDIDIAINQVIRDLTQLGGKTNRLDTAENNFEIQKETLKTFISDIEDKDFAEITMEFQRAQLALQATLGAANATLTLPSLMDFVGR